MKKYSQFISQSLVTLALSNPVPKSPAFSLTATPHVYGIFQILLQESGGQFLPTKVSMTYLTSSSAKFL